MDLGAEEQTLEVVQTMPASRKTRVSPPRMTIKTAEMKQVGNLIKITETHLMIIPDKTTASSDPIRTTSLLTETISMSSLPVISKAPTSVEKVTIKEVVSEVEVVDAATKKNKATEAATIMTITSSDLDTVRMTNLRFKLGGEDTTEEGSACEVASRKEAVAKEEASEDTVEVIRKEVATKLVARTVETTAVTETTLEKKEDHLQEAAVAATLSPTGRQNITTVIKRETINKNKIRTELCPF